MMGMHLGRSKERVDRPDTSELQALTGRCHGTTKDFAAIVARNRDAWIRARINGGQAGTRPPFLGYEHQARLLRVIVHPHVGVQEVRESVAAVLHRLGELWPEEEGMFAAGELPREHCYLSEQAMNEPGAVSVDASRWEAMTQAERLALVAEVRWRPPAVAGLD